MNTQSGSTRLASVAKHPIYRLHCPIPHQPSHGRLTKKIDFFVLDLCVMIGGKCCLRKRLLIFLLLEIVLSNQVDCACCWLR